jgi:hypothetical protein
MFKVLIGCIIGVILMVPQLRHEVVQIGYNLINLVGNLGKFLFTLI